METHLSVLVKQGQQGIKTISSDMKSLSSKFQDSSSVSNSLLLQVEAAIDPIEDPLSASLIRDRYFNLKNECRMLINYRDEVLHESNKARTSHNPLQSDILDFERNFETRHITASEYMIGITELLDERDNIMFEMLRSILDKVGFVVVAYDTVETSDTPRHAQKLLSLLNCFMSMFKVVKSMTQEETSYNMQIIALRHQIEMFQEENIKRSKDYDAIHAQYKALREANKHTTFLRFQQQIDLLESTVLKLKNDINETNDSRLALMESELQLRDKLKETKSELMDLRNLHKKDIDELRPLVENHIQSHSRDQATLHSIRTDVELYKTRMAFIESQFQEISEKLKEKITENQHLKAMVTAERQITKKLRDSSKSRDRISASCASANLAHKITIRELQSKLKQAEEDIKEAEDKLGESKNIISARDRTIKDLEQTIKRCQDGEENLRRQLRATESLMASQQLDMRSLQSDYDKVIQRGQTEEKARETDKLRSDYRQAQLQILQLEVNIKNLLKEQSGKK